MKMRSLFNLLILPTLLYISLPGELFAMLSSSITIGVQSSSNYLYPCNAGIAENSKSKDKGVDFIKGSWIASERNPHASPGNGYAIGGAVQNNNPDPDFGLLSELLSDEILPYGKFNQLLPEATMYDYVIGGGAFATSSDKLQINLSSDTYDAAFYITFCFRPSQFMNNPGLNLVSQELKFVSGKVTHSPIISSINNSSYAKDSALRTMMEIKCLGGNESVEQHYTIGGTKSMSSLLVPFEESNIIDLIPPGGVIINNPDALIYGSTYEVGQLPKMCRIRFYFVETSGKLRPHALLSSDIKIDLDAKVGIFKP